MRTTRSVPVFRSQYLEEDGVASITSEPIRVSGNKGVLAATVLRATSSPGLNIYLDGSYDGRAWIQLAAYEGLPDFGFQSTSATLDVAFVRVRLKITTGSAKARLDATLAFSQQ